MKTGWNAAVLAHGELARWGEDFPARDGVGWGSVIHVARTEELMITSLGPCEAQRYQGSTRNFRPYNSHSQTVRSDL